MSYCKDNDITEKFSNVTLPQTIVVANYRNAAYNRINARLRRIYIVPIVSTDAIDQAILQSIEANIAAGRVLLAVATLHEVENVHEYGKLLISQGEKELKELEEETVVLSSGAARDTDDSDEGIESARILGGAADDYPTFDRPMSGIENDALEGKVDSEKYNELEDTKTV